MDAIAGAGVVGTGVQRVTLASDDPLVTAAATETSLSALAGDVGDTADAAATAGSTGTLHAKQRLMTSQLDSIKTAVETLDNAISGSEMQVDVVGALPAGTNAIGKLAANTGVDIGDVDVTSIVPGTGATNLGKAEDAAHASGDVGVMALSVRQDTATALGGLDADYQPLITDASGRLHVNVGNTVTVGSHAVTNAGTFATQVDGAALTALQLIDNLVLAEDAIHGSGDPGVMALAVQKSADAALQADGDYAPLQVDTSGYLKVNVKAGSAAGTEYTEDAAAAANPVGGALILVREDARAGSLTTTDGDNVAARGTNAGELYVKHVDAIPVTQSGTWDEVGINDSGNSITVDNGGTFAVQATLAAGATTIAKAEDVASADADVGVAAMAVRKATPANTSGTDGDYEMLQMSAGRLWVDPSGVTLTVAAHAVTNAGTFAVQESGGALTALQIMDDWDNAASDGASVSGDVAHDAADAGEPIKVGGRADTTFQTAVADGDRVAALFDVYGVQSVREDHPNKWSYHEDSSSALTDASVQAAPGAGLSVYVTDIMISTGAATALNIFIEEATTKILGPYYLEAVAGRSIHLRFRTPKKCTANTAITVTTSAAIAHGLDITGFIAP